MNASILAEGLKTICAKVLQKNVVLPVLTCVRARPYSGGTEWTVTNLDVWSSIKIDGPELGPLLIPVNWLRSALVGEEVKITTKKDKLIVQSGNLVATTMVIKDSFPDDPETGKIEQSITIDADRLRRMNPLLSRSEGRHQLEQYQCTDGDIWATNGRLAARMVGAAGKFTGLLPGTVPWGMTGEIAVDVSQSHIIATSGNHTIISRRVEGLPTNCRQVCGPLFDASLHWEKNINRKEMIDALTPLSQMDEIAIDFAAGTAVGTKADVGTLENRIPIQTFAAAQGVFSPTYLLDSLHAVSGETVEMHLDPKGRYLTIRGENSDAIIMGRRL